MAKRVKKPKPQTVNINPNQPQPTKPKPQVGQYDKIFQENLDKLLPLLIKEVLKIAFAVEYSRSYRLFLVG